MCDIYAALFYVLQKWMMLAMLRRCVVSVPLTRCYAGRSYVTLAHSATRWPLIQRPCLPAAARSALSPFSQSLPLRCASHRLFFERCFPALSRAMVPPLPRPVSWHHVSQRTKNTYYGFASSKPEPLSTYGKFYHIMLMTLFLSIVFTPLYVLLVGHVT